MLTSVLVAVLAATAPSPAAAPAASPDIDGLVAALTAAGDDRETGDLTNGQHYLASNERDLHLIRDDVRDRGGVLIAVAADPGYILAAWADASAVVFLDLDPTIVALHRIYAAFFRHADTPAEFLALWDDPAAAAPLLTAIAADAADAAALQALHAEAAPPIRRRFADLRRRMQGVPWLLGDAAHYDRVAGLVRAGKVHAVRGDLTRAGVARALGQGLMIEDLDVGLLYLSNIEQYFLYTTDFRANIAGLPFADDGVVLRTLPGRPAGFEYIVESGAHFQRAVKDRKVRSVYRIRGFRRGEPLVGRTRHRIDPPAR